MFKVENLFLDPVCLEKALLTLSILGDKTVVIDVGLGEDVAREVPLLHDVLEVETSCVVLGVEALGVRQNLASLRVVYPECLLLERLLLVFVLGTVINPDGADTNDAHLHYRTLLVEKPQLFHQIRFDFGALVTVVDDFGVDTTVEVFHLHGLLVGRHGRYQSGGDSILC